MSAPARVGPEPVGSGGTDRPEAPGTGPARLGELHAVAVELAGWAVEAIAAGRPEPAAAGTKANPGDWVTPFDRAIERHVRAEIGRRFPGHRVIGEEYGAGPVDGGAADGGRAGGDAGDPAGEPEITWYVDPIDGTTNFVHGLPWASFSLAGYDRAGVAVGVVADAYRGEVLSALRGGGAFSGGTPVRCRTGTPLSGGILLTEWSGGFAWPGMFDLLREVSARFGATRIMGSCALALASVGAGRAAAALLPGKYNRWDVAAGALIAREGGAAVYDRVGPHDGVPEKGILAAAAGTAEEVWQLWRTTAERAEGEAR